VHDLTAGGWISDEPSGVLDALVRAFTTASALRDGGLPFVLSPIPGAGGEIVARVDERFAVTVCVFVEGTTNDSDGFGSDEERVLVLDAVGRIHAATTAIPASLPRRDPLTVPARDEFFEAVADTSAWTGGPYSEPARALVADNLDSVRDRFARYDDLADAVRSSGRPWVVTHGEPHSRNVMRSADGSFLLIDWDTTAIAPPERDLWHIEPRDDAEWSAYRNASGVDRADPNAMALYRLWWTLAEIAGYAVTLCASHVDDANTATAWRGLQEYVLG
jgi:spectinomycin phosphotransferase